MLPPAHLTLRSPYDPQAHIGRKGGFSWYGYKVHLSESCDAGYPQLITCVQTTDATASDMKQTPMVHEELARRGFLPQTHLVDAGYVDAGLIVESRSSYGVDLLGPVSRNNQWQAKAGKGYDLSGFEVDFEAKEATCPQGQKSIDWKEMRDQYGHPKLYIRFEEKTCRECPCRTLCTRAQEKPRRLSLRSQEEFLQLQRRRKQQGTEEFQVTYAKQAGIEGTHSQGVRALGLRQSRYIGLQKASLQHALIAAALNLLRLDNFITWKKDGTNKNFSFCCSCSQDGSLNRLSVIRQRYQLSAWCPTFLFQTPMCPSALTTSSSLDNALPVLHLCSCCYWNKVVISNTRSSRHRYTRL